MEVQELADFDRLSAQDPERFPPAAGRFLRCVLEARVDEVQEMLQTGQVEPNALWDGIPLVSASVLYDGLLVSPDARLESIRHLLQAQADPNLRDADLFRPLSAVIACAAEHVFDEWLDLSEAEAAAIDAPRDLAAELAAAEDPGALADDSLPHWNIRRSPPARRDKVQQLKALLELLLDHGADPNLPSRGGRSALSLAVGEAPDSIVRLLLEAGGDPNLVLPREQPPPMRGMRFGAGFGAGLGGDRGDRGDNDAGGDDGEDAGPGGRNAAANHRGGAQQRDARDAANRANNANRNGNGNANGNVDGNANGHENANPNANANDGVDADADAEVVIDGDDDEADILNPGINNPDAAVNPNNLAVNPNINPNMDPNVERQPHHAQPGLHDAPGAPGVVPDAAGGLVRPVQGPANRPHRSPFMQACSIRRANVARMLLRAGGDVHARCPTGGGTPFLQALVYCPEPRLLRELIAAGSDLHATSRHGSGAVMSLLFCRDEQAMLEGLDLLLGEHGLDVNVRDRDGLGALSLAMQESCSLQVVRRLLDYNCEVNTADEGLKTPLMDAVQWASPDHVQMLLDARADVHAVRDDGFSVIHMAVVHQHPETVRLLLRANASLETRTSEGNTPLALAASYGSPEMLRLVWELHPVFDNHLGHNPERPEEPLNSELMNALLGQRTQNCKILLEADADPNCREGLSGDAAIYLAAEQGLCEIARMLLEARADPNARAAEDNDSPLCVAAERGHLYLVKLLVEHGADPLMPGRHGETLEAVANHYGSPAMQALVRQLLGQPARPGDPSPEELEVMAQAQLQADLDRPDVAGVPEDEGYGPGEGDEGDEGDYDDEGDWDEEDEAWDDGGYCDHHHHDHHDHHHDHHDHHHHHHNHHNQRNNNNNNRNNQNPQHPRNAHFMLPMAPMDMGQLQAAHQAFVQMMAGLNMDGLPGGDNDDQGQGGDADPEARLAAQDRILARMMELAPAGGAGGAGGVHGVDRDVPEDPREMLRQLGQLFRAAAAMQGDDHGGRRGGAQQQQQRQGAGNQGQPGGDQNPPGPGPGPGPGADDGMDG